MSMKSLGLALAALGVVSGCAAIQLPPEQLQRNEASIRAAEEVGALNVPEAKLHLQLAKDQTEQAKIMAEDGDERALVVLARAESDSELALALTREKAAHSEAIQAEATLKAVRNREESSSAGDMYRASESGEELQ